MVEFQLTDISSLDAITRQLPQGFYTTFRTYGGRKRVLGLRAHLQRLYKPASTHNISPCVPADILRHHLADILQGYSDEARVRTIMASSGQIYIALTALRPLPQKFYQDGVKAVTTDVQRERPRQKSTFFISKSDNIRTKIANNGVFEALIVKNNAILEGMTSNFFYVKEGILGTARKDILLGVTRRTVLRVAQGNGISRAYRALKRKQVPAISEAFLTSSSRGIVPIVQIDDMLVGEGRPGSVTKQLMDLYADFVTHNAELI